MKSKALRTLFSIPCVIILGCLDIIGTLLEMVYQVARLIKRGFNLFGNMVYTSFISLLEDKTDYGIEKPDKNNYEIFDVEYEED